MCDEAASRLHILPRACSSIEANALSQVSWDLFDDNPDYTFTTKSDATSLLFEQIWPWAMRVIIYASIISGLMS